MMSKDGSFGKDPSLSLMRSKAYKTEGIILKRLNLGEADRILTIYTKHYGKIRAIAKGVRRITSRRGGSVELFNHAVIFLHRGSNLDVLAEAQTIDSFTSWRRDLSKIGLAYYFCELVDKLTPDGQPNGEVFELLKNFLGQIDIGTSDLFIRSFEEYLLQELGFGVPEEIKSTPGILKNYIEEIIEKRINSQRIFRNLA